MAFPLGRQLKVVLGPLVAESIIHGLAAQDGGRCAAEAGPGFLLPGGSADLRWALSAQVDGLVFHRVLVVGHWRSRRAGRGRG